MAITLLEASPVGPVVEPSVNALIAEASSRVERAAALRVESLSDEVLGEAIAGLAVVESRATAVRMSLSAEADRRRVAEQTAETGTDVWVARLTGSTREQAAGGLRIARLLAEKYAATREAFAAGRLRFEQVRVIVGAAEQAPAEATRDQVQMAEEWLVAKATGDGSRTGRGRDAKRLRQTARRMFTCVDHDPREVSPNRARGPTRTPDPSAHSPPTTAAPRTPASTSAEDPTATGPTTAGRSWYEPSGG